MKKLGVSIGIPAFNEEGNIKILLKSLLSQKGDNMEIAEIIVISDGSTDKTVSKINSIHNHKIKLIEGKERLGQIERLNQMIALADKGTDFILFLEADTLPVNSYFVSNLVKKAPNDGKFSIIQAESIPLPAATFVGEIILAGVNFKRELFEKALPKFNLYTHTTGLLSKEFLRNFRWDANFHEDSYLFRQTVKSGLPIFKSKIAKIYYKPVESLSDYFTQSGKFQKALQREKEYSDIYNFELDYLEAIRIFVKHFLKNPFLLLSYLMIASISRLYSFFLPAYSQFWKVYKTTKRLSYD